jgi:hypothetical protein
MNRLSFIPMIAVVLLSTKSLAGNLNVSGDITSSNITAVQSITLGGVAQTNWPSTSIAGAIDLTSALVDFTQTGLLYRFTLTNNASWTFTNHVAGRMVLLQISESGTGGWTNSWPTGLLWPFGSTINPADVSSNSINVYEILDNGTRWLMQAEGLDYELPCSNDCYALQFNGSNYITVDSGSQWAPTNFTFEAWVMSNQGQPDGGAGALGSTMQFGGATHGWLAAFDDAGVFNFSGYLSGGSYFSVGGTASINNGAWHHVAVTYDGTNMVTYVDGSQDATTTTSGGPLAAASQLDLGVMSGVYGYQYYGTLDEVRISSVVRYTGTFTPAYHPDADSDTIALWHFGEDGGSTAYDVTGNHNGGLQGSPAWVQGR